MINNIREFLKKSIHNGFAQNALLNTVSAAIPVIILQLFVLPYIGKKTGSDHYGLIVTLLSMFNLIPSTMGNCLNNIRLLYNSYYEKAKKKGDFSLLLFIILIINFFAVLFLSCYYLRGHILKKDLLIQLFLIEITSLLILLKEYFVTAFLLQLNYIYILIDNILLAIGYIFGCVILYFLNLWDMWEMIYIAGYSFSIFFILIKSDIWKEPLCKTSLFPIVLKENFVYLLSCFLYRFIAFADKMLLFPLLGGTMVSIYYVATLSGKVVNMVITPLSGVMLSYISKKETVERQSFLKVIRTSFVCCLAGYFICIFASKPIFNILYPEYSDQAMKYVYITTLNICIGVLISLINPYILKRMEMKWQVKINLITFIIYLVSSFILLKILGLYGFCIGTVISNAAKLAIMLIIYYNSFQNKGDEKIEIEN